MKDFILGEEVMKATDEYFKRYFPELKIRPSVVLCPICELPEDDESCPHIWTTFKEIPLGEDFWDENGNWLEKRSEKMGLGWCDGNPEYLFFQPEEKVRHK